MRNALLVAVVAAAMAAPVVVSGQEGDRDGQGGYPQEVLERYWECMERNDLNQIRELVWYHHNVARVDASIYGLPPDDFDDRSDLTIEERFQHRAAKAALAGQRGYVPMATSGPVQYAHHLREALDHYYESTGLRPDCSAILAEAGVSGSETEAMGSGWAADLNITSTDSVDRGEVNIVVDFANPNRLMVSSCPSGSAPDSSSNFIAYSSNWGQSWTRTAVGNNSGSTWECDPVSYYQRSTGRAYHSKIGCNTGMCRETYTMMRYSANNGSSWADCGRPGAQTSEDRQWHVVDNTVQYDANDDGVVDTANACYGNIYITWHNSNQETVARSTDNCATWVNRTTLTSTYQAITPDINAAANGHVYVVWQNHGDATFKIAGSSNCGQTWNAPSAKTVKARLGDWSNDIPAQCQRGIATQPLVDVDRAPRSDFYGRLYVAMLDFNQSGCGSGPGCTTWDTACNYDIWFTSSDDNGSTFSTPVNLTSGEGNRVDHFMGYMRVDESDGSIYLSYHRTRLNPTALVDRQKTHEFVMRSTDGGATWANYQASTLEGDERLSGASTFERGDYNSLDVYQGVVWPVWVDRRNTSGVEEIVTRKICTEPSHWSERSPTFAPPTITVANGSGAGTVDISWAAPDIHWGDGGEGTTARKYQLWVDGSLAQDNIAWTANSVDEYSIGNCNSHSYVIRAVNQCGVYKDYVARSFSATNCCANNPTSVDVAPNGPLTLCQGTGQLLTATATGGSAPFTYEWYRDGALIGGASGSTYTATDTGTHAYNCEVTGSGCSSGTMDSATTSITWQAAPTFAGLQSVSNPQNATCTLDLSWNVATTVCSGPLQYSVYRSTSSGFTPGAGNRIAIGLSCAASPCTYSDTDGLVSGTPYYYVVRATDLSTGAEEDNTAERTGTPTGPNVAQTPYLDDFDGNRPANAADYWIEATFSGDDNGADELALNTSRYRSATTSYKFGGTGTGSYTANEDNALILGGDGTGASGANGFTIPAGSTNVRLRFWHAYNMEASWDGAMLYYSTTGWSSGYAQVPDTDQGGPYISSGAYTGTISSGSVEAWNGNRVSSFTEVVVNCDALVGQTVWFLWRFYTDTTQNYEGYYLDDVRLEGTFPGTCTSGSSCTNPDAPVITGITDESACAQSGIRVSYTAGSGATSHDLYRDSVRAVTGYASGALYDPGDTSSHSYVVRAVVSTCFTDSASQSFTDANGTPAAPGAPSVTDADVCTQSGVNVSWGSVSGATAYDLRVDGTTTVSDVTSPHLYNPGDSASHTYEVRGRSSTCTGAWSSATSTSDANGISTPAAPSVADVSACALSGGQVTWGAVSGATAYDLLVDGTTTVAGVTSPYTYSPGNSSSHTYQVRGRSASCSSPYSAGTAGVDANYALTAFAGIQTVADRDVCDDTGVRVTWSPPSSWNDAGGTRSFVVRRDGAGISGALGDATSFYDDTGGADGTTYTYTVLATNGAGCSFDGGASLTGSDQVGSPPTFGGLTSASAIPDTCGLRLEWPAATSNCATAPSVVYNVYRSTSSTFTPDAGNRIASCVPDLFYEDTVSVTGGVPYYYVVRAEDSSVGHGGPCNGGFEETNTTLRTAMAGGGDVTWSAGAETGDPLMDTSTYVVNPWARVTTRAHSGTYSYRSQSGSTYANSECNSLVTPALQLTVGQSPVLTFWAGWLIQNRYDGGVVGISTDDGATWTDFTNTELDPDYPGSFRNSSDACGYSLNTPCFTNAPTFSWTPFTVSLAGFAGQTVRLRWRLSTDGDTTNEGLYVDDIQVTHVQTGNACSTPPNPLQFFTATSTSGQNKLEWLGPDAGECSLVRVLRKEGSYPTGPADAGATLVGGAEIACGGTSSYGTVDDAGSNGTTYYYAAFVRDSAGVYSAMQTVSGRPQDTTGTTPGSVKWVYNTGATALTPPGLGSLFGVSNDRVLHGVVSGATGGTWPRPGWAPMVMNAPAQGRPSVLEPMINGVETVVLGSQDGHVYAVDATTGAELWHAPATGDFGQVQATPSGIFTDYGGGTDLTLVGTRNAGQDNSFHGIYPLGSGDRDPSWSYDGAGVGGIGIVSGDAWVEYTSPPRVYFASRERSAGSGTLWCLEFGASSANLCSGSWPVALGDVDGGPVVRGGTVYVGNNAGVVHAVSAVDGGAPLWSYATNDGPVKGFVWADWMSDDLYLSTTERVWSLQDATPRLRWSTDVSGRPSMPLVVGGHVVVGSTDGRLHRLSASDGAEVDVGWVLGDGTAAVGSPTYEVGTGLVYVGSESGAVYAVRLTGSGEEEAP